MKDANARHTQLPGFFLVLFFIFLFAPAVQAAEDANFSWLPNQETNLAGYEIHYGTASGNYTTIVDVGNPPPVDGRIHGQVAGANLNDGTTYYFAAVAKDTSGLKSDYSTEVVWTATSVPANEPPIAENSAITVSEDSSAGGQLQAQDPDSDSLTYSVVTNPGKGTLTLNTTGAFTYTPNTGATGTDSFTFQASDGQATSNTATVSITITETNDPPIAENSAITVNEDTAVNGQLQAQDPNGDNLTYSVVANPAQGTLTLNTTGAFTYTPNANATGTDSFSFQVSDGQATSNIATVSIIINPANDAPVAQGVTLNAVIGQTTSGTLQANDPDNDPLTFRLVSDPQQTVTMTNSTTGAYTFTPGAGMSSPYTFTFTVNDGTVDSNTATVTVTLLEAGAVTEIFGDTPDSNHPGTLIDTFTNINNDINATAEHISTWSWSSPTPHKPANTIIIKTDLSALRMTLQITEAKLYLYQTDFHGETTYENSIHKITGKNPIIDQVTGYNAFNGEPWTPVTPGTTSRDVPLGFADIDQAADTLVLGTQQGYQTWVITDMVQEWISDPDGNFGLLISGIPTNTETGRTFAASENQNGTLRPKLVIRYINKPPKPTVFSAKQIQ